MYDRPFENGRTIYTASIQFSNDYPPVGEEGHPLQWDWSGLLDEPDARCTRVAETPNPHYGRDVVALALGALRDYRMAIKVAAAIRDRANETDDLDDMVAADNAATEAYENYCAVLADNLAAVLDSIGVQA